MPEYIPCLGVRGQGMLHEEVMHLRVHQELTRWRHERMLAGHGLESDLVLEAIISDVNCLGWKDLILRMCSHSEILMMRH